MDDNNQDCSLPVSKRFCPAKNRSILRRFRPANNRSILRDEESFERQPLPDRDYDPSPIDTTSSANNHSILKGFHPANNRSILRDEESFDQQPLLDRDYNLSSIDPTSSANNRSILRGEESFERQPLPDRDYNLSPIDPTNPSIHILIDDVIMNILKYLPLKERIRCEIVCRRWQALLYVMFESTTHLNLDNSYFIKSSHPPFSKVNIAKLLKIRLLTGKSLKSFSIIESSSNWHDDLLKEVISVFPFLEKICVHDFQIKGQWLNVLPKGLKELDISLCMMVSKENLHKVSKICKDLEVLDTVGVDGVDKQFLKELGVNCANLRKLNISTSLDVTNQVKVFTKLKCLKIVAPTFEFSNIADSIKGLEELSIEIQETTSLIDFGKFTHLKIVRILSGPFYKQELLSLQKCKKLEDVYINDGKGVDQEMIKDIVKSCPKIKKISFPKVFINTKFITDINEIMKTRLDPIKILVIGWNLPSDEVVEALYDPKKIAFEFEDYVPAHYVDYFDY